jgi:hypothetical protein
MDDHRLTWPYLESLTTGELAVLADNLGIEIPPALERNFIVEALIEASFEDEYELEEQEPLDEADFLEPVQLPHQYNITYIDVLIRDPLWVFAFWEIKGHDREIHEKAPDFGGYFLRVQAVPPSRLRSGYERPEDTSFTVPVGIDDTAWYLGFSPASAGTTGISAAGFGKAGGGRAACLQVELCVLRDTESEVLAVSKTFRLPSLLAAAPSDIPLDPLCRLSGLDDLPVLRNGDRLSRTLRGSQS